MADYHLTGVWLNGEHLIVRDGLLSTREGLEAATWTVELDGAHELYHQVNERVDLRMAVGDGREVEGSARVIDSGRHDETSKIYDDVRFEGLSMLKTVR